MNRLLIYINYSACLGEAQQRWASSMSLYLVNPVILSKNVIPSKTIKSVEICVNLWPFLCKTNPILSADGGLQVLL
jgi:hypothetical protein